MRFIKLTTNLNAKLPATTGKLNYLRVFYNLLNRHYTQHCYEPLPMLSVKEFINSVDNNQFVLKIIVQRDNFKNQNYSNDYHIHFDDDGIAVSNCNVSTKDYLFIIDGTT